MLQSKYNVPVVLGTFLTNKQCRRGYRSYCLSRRLYQASLPLQETLASSQRPPHALEVRDGVCESESDGSAHVQAQELVGSGRKGESAQPDKFRCCLLD